jgi:hypothetical protein
MRIARAIENIQCNISDFPEGQTELKNNSNWNRTIEKFESVGENVENWKLVKMDTIASHRQVEIM